MRQLLYCLGVKVWEQTDSVKRTNGLQNSVVGLGIPYYASMIANELWMMNGQYYVKVRQVQRKKSQWNICSFSSLQTLTRNWRISRGKATFVISISSESVSLIPTCKSDLCPLNTLLTYVQRYLPADATKVCSCDCAFVFWNEISTRINCRNAQSIDSLLDILPSIRAFDPLDTRVSSLSIDLHALLSFFCAQTSEILIERLVINCVHSIRMRKKEDKSTCMLSQTQRKTSTPNQQTNCLLLFTYVTVCLLGIETDSLNLLRKRMVIKFSTTCLPLTSSISVIVKLDYCHVRSLIFTDRARNRKGPLPSPSSIHSRWSSPFFSPLFFSLPYSLQYSQRIDWSWRRR